MPDERRGRRAVAERTPPPVAAGAVSNNAYRLGRVVGSGRPMTDTPRTPSIIILYELAKAPQRRTTTPEPEERAIRSICAR